MSLIILQQNGKKSQMQQTLILRRLKQEEEHKLQFQVMAKTYLLVEVSLIQTTAPHRNI